MLNKHFLEYAKAAKDSGIICHLTTNGSMFNDDLMQALIDIRFDSVKFSFQGVDAEGYEELRQTNDFDTLMKKIARFRELRGDKDYPFITIGTTVTDESAEKVAAFREKYSNICDKMEIGFTNLENLQPEMLTDPERRKRLIDLKQRQNLKKIRLKMCNQVFDVLTVRWNGDVSVCCSDVNGKAILGNIMDTPLKNLWNSDMEQHYRDVLSRREYDKLELCKNCYDFMGFEGSANAL